MRSAPVMTVMLNPAIDRLINVPRLVPGEHIKGTLRARYPAGKAINVSRALAIAGCANIATGLIGRGEIELYESFLRERHGDGIQCRFVPVDGRTRENITLIDPKQDTHIRDAGFAVTAGDVERLHNVLRDVIEPRAAVCICGSLPPGFDQAMLMQLVDLIESNGGRVIVDSNGPHMPAVAQRGVEMIKPNARELREITGHDGDLHALASTLTDHVATLLVSDGANGAGVMTSRHTMWGKLPLEADEVRNTVGCGDCLLAGFIAAKVRGEADEAALRCAMACAAANAIAGTTAGFANEDIDAVLARVTIEPWRQN